MRKIEPLQLAPEALRKQIWNKVMRSMSLEEWKVYYYDYNYRSKPF